MRSSPHDDTDSISLSHAVRNQHIRQFDSSDVRLCVGVTSRLKDDVILIPKHLGCEPEIPNGFRSMNVDLERSAVNDNIFCSEGRGGGRETLENTGNLVAEPVPESVGYWERDSRRLSQPGLLQAIQSSSCHGKCSKQQEEAAIVMPKSILNLASQTMFQPLARDAHIQLTVQEWTR